MFFGDGNALGEKNGRRGHVEKGSFGCNSVLRNASFHRIRRLLGLYPIFLHAVCFLVEGLQLLGLHFYESILTALVIL